MYSIFLKFFFSRKDFYVYKCIFIQRLDFDERKKQGRAWQSFFNVVAAVQPQKNFRKCTKRYHTIRLP